MRKVSVLGLPMIYAGDVDGVPTRERAIREAEVERSPELLVYAPAWRRHIEPSRRKLTFADGKGLLFRVFDRLDLLRSYMKCMPLHYRDLGYATPEWEVFTQQETWDDLVLHEAAHLVCWDGPDQESCNGRSLIWFSNYVCLLLEFGLIEASHVKAFALDVVREFGRSLPEEFACRVRLEGRQA